MRKFIFLLILPLFFVDCKNDKTDDLVLVCKSKSLAEYFFLDAFRESLLLVPAYMVNGDSPDQGPTLSADENITSSVYPKLMTIDYGEINQLGQMGINRRGKIQVQIKGEEALKGSFTVSFDDFYINDTRLLGSFSSNLLDSQGKEGYRIELNESCKLSNANGTMSWSGILSLKTLSGKSTITPLDDTFALEETTEGQDFIGRSYSSKSKVSYKADFSCKWIITAGQGEINPTDRRPLTIDYDSKGCSEVINVLDGDEKNPLSFSLE